MKEYYNLPILFTQEEREQYAAYGIKKEKTTMPVAILTFAGYVALLVGTFLYLWHTRGRVPAGQNFLLTSGAFLLYTTDGMLFLFGFLLFKPLDMLCDKILGRPATSRMLRLEPMQDGVWYQMEQGKTLLCEGAFSWEEWEQAILPDSNQIWIQNECLTIGENTIESIYPPEKRKQWLERPAEKIVGTIQLQQIQKNLDGYRASLEEKKREEAWCRQNGIDQSE